MKLSFEIPLPHFEEFAPLEDFHFGLAQFCFDAYYEKADWYCEVYKGCLLDNGMYELGSPLTCEELVEAAKRCRPVAVIAPDWMNDFHRTLSATLRLLYLSRNYAWSVGGVVQGRDLDERVKCFHIMQELGCRPICFPFRTPREETIRAVASSLHVGGWYHLLGLPLVTVM